MTPAAHACVKVVRVYDDAGRNRGEYRVLVDRLWPRGLRKIAVDFDEWAKDAAPSTELRIWYGHDVDRFSKFACRYKSELERSPGVLVVERLREITRGGGLLVLLTATRDVEHSAAQVLRDVIAVPGDR